MDLEVEWDGVPKFASWQEPMTRPSYYDSGPSLFIKAANPMTN